MSARFFLDTNIFVYSFDQSMAEKKARATALIQQAVVSGDGIISIQVVQEFLNVATRKFEIPMKVADCKQYLASVLNPLCRVYPDNDLYEACLDLQEKAGYSFYDSLILAAALKSGCDTLYSEDLQDGQLIEGMMIVNPFFD